MDAADAEGGAMSDFCSVNDQPILSEFKKQEWLLIPRERHEQLERDRDELLATLLDLIGNAGAVVATIDRNQLVSHLRDANDRAIAVYERITLKKSDSGEKIM
jgi:hypothetical protein